MLINVYQFKETHMVDTHSHIHTDTDTDTHWSMNGKEKKKNCEN